MYENIEGYTGEYPKLKLKLPTHKRVIEFCPKNRIIIEVIIIRK